MYMTWITWIDNQRMEGACIIRSGIEGIISTTAAHALGLKVKHALIQPDLIITLNGKSFAFLLEGCLRSINPATFYQQSVKDTLGLWLEAKISHL